MNLSFSEKSAWGLLIALLVLSAYYFPTALTIVESADKAAPLIRLFASGVISLIIIEIIYNAVIAGSTSIGANLRDERDELINLKAERNGGFVLGIGLFWLIGFIVLQSEFQAYQVPGPLKIAVYILLAIVGSEIAKLSSQIWYYRTGV